MLDTTTGRIAPRYFDYNATTPLAPEVRDAMAPFLADAFHNPSASYRGAARVRHAIETARAQVAGLLHCRPEEIVFTSGGTEALNHAIFGVSGPYETGRHVITSRIEHPAVLNSVRSLEGRGSQATYLDVDGNGQVDPVALAAAIGPATRLVAIMLANNEIGSIQPIAALAAIARAHGMPFVCDAVQAAGKLEIDVAALGVDLLAISGHKFYGPKGSGALFVRSGVVLDPLLHGGSQEQHRRAGTENVPGIIGLGAAAALAQADHVTESARVFALRQSLRDGLQELVPGIRFNPASGEALANTLSVTVPGIDSGALLAYLDQDGFAASAGSACATSAAEPSHVLAAIGLGAGDARSTLRLSLGRYTTASDIAELLALLPGLVKRLRGR
jgi:cysteine desulfurase